MAATLPINPVSFKKGDFIKNKQQHGSFAIFEGRDVTPSTYVTRHYSLALYYNPKKYMLQENGSWDYSPTLEVSTPSEPCKTDVDTMREDYWWGPCSDSEVMTAMQILYDNGYIYDPDTMTLTDRVSGKVIRQLADPTPSYNGEKIKPITKGLRHSLHSCIHFKAARTSYNSGNNYYHDQYYPHWD